MDLATLDTLTKVCRSCGIDKALSEFSKEKKKKDGLKIYCKPCENARFKAWREENIEEILLKDRIKHYVRKYGLSKEKAIELVEDRNGACEICKEHKPLVVDHHHDTGMVRGMICSACNSMVGYSRENPDVLAACIEYLGKYHGTR
jgi:hypothetical protein